MHGVSRIFRGRENRPLPLAKPAQGGLVIDGYVHTGLYQLIFLALCGRFMP
jgi:hypothetical protein